MSFIQIAFYRRSLPQCNLGKSIVGHLCGITGSSAYHWTESCMYVFTHAVLFGILNPRLRASLLRIRSWDIPASPVSRTNTRVSTCVTKCARLDRPVVWVTHFALSPRSRLKVAGVRKFGQRLKTSLETTNNAPSASSPVQPQSLGWMVL